MTRIAYKVEVRDAIGTRLWELKDIDSGELDQQVNSPARVSITCPMTWNTSQALSDLTRANALWVWKNGVLAFAGPINIVELSHNNSLASVRIDALDYMESLKTEFVDTYDETETVSTHVTNMLAFQVSLSPVMSGTIEPVVTRDITIDQVYIYDALNNLRKSVGGYLTVDPQRRLNWYWSLSPNTGQQIRYRKNLTHITKNTDWMNFGNKLYIYGDGCDLTDAGWPTVYIEDANSITNYGVVVRVIQAGDFPTAATLLEYAKLQIAEMSNPRTTYTVNIVNLEDFGSYYDTLALGSYVTVIDDEIDVNVEVQIVRLVQDLVQGHVVKVELSAKGLDICDTTLGSYLF